MRSPIKDLTFTPKSLQVLKQMIPPGAKVDSYLLYSGELEMNLAKDNRHVVSHTTSFMIYDFWRGMFDSPDIILKAVEHFWPIKDPNLFNTYQTGFRRFKDHLVRAAMFFILNRCSSEGKIQTGVFDAKNFNPIALTYIKRFERINFDVAWDDKDDFIDSINTQTDADYIYFPVGKFSYNFFDEGKSRGFDDTMVNHKLLCEKVKELDKKVILDYIYHPRLLKIYRDFPTKIFIDQHGRVVQNAEDAKEVLIANY
tara:strand:- start:127 stop:891 length:765 start_codon:yes stop_codon:yes gene_type:complete